MFKIALHLIFMIARNNTNCRMFIQIDSILNNFHFHLVYNSKLSDTKWEVNSREIIFATISDCYNKSREDNETSNKLRYWTLQRRKILGRRESGAIWISEKNIIRNNSDGSLHIEIARGPYSPYDHEFRFVIFTPTIPGWGGGIQYWPEAFKLALSQVIRRIRP